MKSSSSLLVRGLLATAVVFAVSLPASAYQTPETSRFWVKLPGTHFLLRTVRENGVTKVEMIPAQSVGTLGDPVAQPVLEHLRALPIQTQKVLGSVKVYVDSPQETAIFEGLRRETLAQSDVLFNAIVHKQPAHKLIEYYRVFDWDLTRTLALALEWETLPELVKQDLVSLGDANVAVRRALGLYTPTDADSMASAVAEGLALSLRSLKQNAEQLRVEQSIRDRIDDAEQSAWAIARKLRRSPTLGSIAGEQRAFQSRWRAVEEQFPAFIESGVTTRSQLEAMRRLEIALETLLPRNEELSPERVTRSRRQLLDLALELDHQVQGWPAADAETATVKASSKTFLRMVDAMSRGEATSYAELAERLTAVTQSWDQFVAALGQLPPGALADVNETTGAIVARLASLEAALR